MKKEYLKHNNNLVTEIAPKNKGAVSNYNSSSNHNQLVADGYEFLEWEYGFDGQKYLNGFAPALPVASTPTDEQLAQEIRNQRNQLLTACDWTQISDAPLSYTEKQAWAIYRQALRDITLQEGFPQNVIYPEFKVENGEV